MGIQWMVHWWVLVHHGPPTSIPHGALVAVGSLWPQTISDPSITEFLATVVPWQPLTSIYIIF
jgi:hypothetical protein